MPGPSDLVGLLWLARDALGLLRPRGWSLWTRSEGLLEQCRRRGDDRPTPRMDDLDDFGRVDPLQIDRGHSKVGVTELALDDI